MLFCLCVSLAAWIPPPLSLTLARSLFILGFTVSIPKGRSIDCNSFSMKSPLCCWRNETSFNWTITLFLCSFWSLPLFPSIFIYISLTFFLRRMRVQAAVRGHRRGFVRWSVRTGTKEPSHYTFTSERCKRHIISRGPKGGRQCGKSKRFSKR